MRAMRRRYHAIHLLIWKKGLGVINPEASDRIEMAGWLGDAEANGRASSAGSQLKQTLHHPHIVRIVRLAWAYAPKHIHDRGHPLVRGIEDQDATHLRNLLAGFNESHYPALIAALAIPGAMDARIGAISRVPLH